MKRLYLLLCAALFDAILCKAKTPQVKPILHHGQQHSVINAPQPHQKPQSQPSQTSSTTDKSGTKVTGKTPSKTDSKKKAVAGKAKAARGTSALESDVPAEITRIGSRENVDILTDVWKSAKGDFSARMNAVTNTANNLSWPSGNPFSQSGD